MFVDKDSLMVNDISLGPYILEAKYEYHKLWGKDSGRNLAGEQTGTLLGIFPKIIVTFRKLTKDEMMIISPILDSAQQRVLYFDPTLGHTTAMNTYTGDISFINKGIVDNNRKNSSFSCSFIAKSKRV